MLMILTSKFISYLTDRFTDIKYFLFGHSNQFGLNVFQCCFAFFFLYQSTEIIWRQMKVTGKIRNGWNACFKWFFRTEKQS